MLHVAYVAPYFSTNTHHVLRSLLQLEGVRVSVLTQEDPTRVPLRDRLAGIARIRNSVEGTAIEAGCRELAAKVGKVDRLIGFLEQMQLPLAEARDALGIPGMTAEVARNFREKNQMKRVLMEAGLPVARQALVHSGEDVRRFLALVGFPIVLKPPAGMGSRGTMRVADDLELASALEQLAPSPENPIQAEEFVRGEEHTFETVTIDGVPVWHSSVYYLPGPLAVLENPWMQYCVLLPRERSAPHVEAFAPVNAAALKALGMGTGLSHMEWFLTADGRQVISEVGARPPGVNIVPMMGYAHGVDMWALWAKLMVFGTFEIPERQFACGCAFLRGQGRGRVVRAVHGIAEAQQKVKGLVLGHQLPRPGQSRGTGYEGEGWIMVRHPETRVVVDALRDIVTTITVELG